MLVALTIAWIFWLLVLGMMAFWRRSWVNLLAFPVVVSLVLWLLSRWSESASIWVSAVLHGGLFVLLVGVAIFGRRPGDDPFFQRPSKEP